MLFEAFTNHLRGLPGLEVLVILDLLVLHLYRALVLLFEGLLPQFAFCCPTDKLTFKSDDLGITVCDLLVLGLHCF